MLLSAAIALVIAGSAPAAADAAETVIGFDDQATGTVIGNQYEAQGVTFDVTPSGAANLHPTVVEPPAGEPHSAPKALDLSQKCGSEFAEAHMWARFAAPRGYVAIYVGNVEPTEGFPANVTLQGYDLGGNPIPAAKETREITGKGINTILEVSDAEADISYVQLTSGALCHVAVDDLTFESLPSTIPPDFGLSGPSLATTITPGGSASVPLVLHRNSTSVGPISFGVSGLPPGVSATVSPNPSSGPDGSALTLSLSANANAPPVSNSIVTVEGVPSITAGELARSVSFPVSVAGNYDLRAQGLEVTQGIQPEGELKPSGSNESGGTYNWLSLVAHKKTAVRFFADAHGQIASGIKEVGALLYGFSDGRELPGSPLRPDYGPPSTQGGGPGLTSVQESGPAPVLEAERTSNEHAYTFTLPESWTDSGTISLRGHIFQEPGFPSPGRRPECSTGECTSNNDFTLNGVKFYETKTVALDTVALQANGELPVSASAATEDARLVAPLAEPGWNIHNPNDGFTVLPYQGVIDISDIVNSSSNATDKGNDAHGRVKDWASAMGNPNFSTMGIGKSGFRGVTGGGIETAFGTFGNVSAITFDPTNSQENRPLSGVAHELFHQFGLSHASAECGGGASGGSTTWPLKPGETHASEAAALGIANADPNSTEGFGQLLGIGLRMDSYPYKIIADGVSWAQNMDLMSYCVANAGGWENGDPGVWVSPINWDAVYRTFAASANAHASSSAADGRTRSAVRNVRVNHGRLRVIGYSSSSGSSFTFTTVGPQVGPPLQTGKSGFTLVARGRRGQILHSAPMAEQEIHADEAAVMIELSAEVPSHGVEAVEVLDNGVAIGKRERPRRRPRVRVLAPRPGAVVGGKSDVAVRWRTIGASSKGDTASVDFSGDGGRTWRAVYIGPDRGTAKIPGTYLAGAHRARLRVRVNDGFDEAESTSAIFTSRAAPPEVTISRTPGQLPGDARLQLTGQAFQAGPTTLKGKSLRWFDGSAPLGSGTEIMTGPLPPGKNHIRLVAHGDGGSSATAAVNVKVSPVRLPFLRLKIPKSAPRRANRVVIKASSAVPALLTVDGSKFKIGKKNKKLHVAIAPRSGPWLRMTVTAAGVRTAFAAIVRRG